MKLASRVALALAQCVVRTFSCMVPRGRRDAWIEEWQAELTHATIEHRYSSLRLLRMSAGALADAASTRKVDVRREVSRPRRAPLQLLDQDFRYAVRSLAASPRFTIGVACSLAVGIAANAATFSLLNALVFRPFPGVRDQRDLLSIHLRSYRNGLPYGHGSHDAYVALRDGMSTLSGVAASRRAQFAVSLNDLAVTIHGELVSANYFDVVAAQPLAGRHFTAQDDITAHQHPVAVIGEGFWTRYFNRDPSAVGQFIKVNGAHLQIIGVAPPRFAGLTLQDDERDNHQLWIPLALGELVLRDRLHRPVSAQDPSISFGFVGRLKAGVTTEQVLSEASIIAARLTKQSADPKEPISAVVKHIPPVAEALPMMIGTMAIPFIVLAIACVNAANLLLARASRSSRDWNTRLALGATRWRIVRQVLVESLLLALLASLAGLLLTQVLSSLVQAYLPLRLALDHRVLLFTLATAAATALCFGIMPALHIAKRSGRLDARAPTLAPRSHTRSALIVLQAALSLGLLATGAQFVRTLQSRIADDGIDHPERMLIAQFDVGSLRRTSEAAENFYTRLLDRLAAQRAVSGVALTDANPWGAWSGRSLRLWLPDDKPGSPRGTLAMYAKGSIFEALAIDVVEGRALTKDDERARPWPLVVNQPFADKMFAGRALGRTMRVGLTNDYAFSVDAIIVGVVAAPAVKRVDSLPMVFYPSPLAPMPARWLYVQFAGSAAEAIPSLRATVREIDRDVPFVQIDTAAGMRAKRNEPQRFLALSITALGLLALGLAAAGLYGVVSYVVVMRTQEIGVRMALGAEPAAVLRMFVLQALTPTAIGAFIGAAGAVAVGAIIRSRLYGTSIVDPLAFGAAMLLLMAVMLLASTLPARRAARVDPVVVLREL